MKVIIIHGTEGSPNGNWFPWLAKELRAAGHEVFVPQFPTPENQSIKTWCEVLRKTAPHFEDDTILIGHSTGATYLLSVLEQLEKPVAQTILVSGYTSPIDRGQYDEWNKPFYDKRFDWQKIRANTKQLFIFHGDDDPYVPLSQAREIAQNLNADLTVIRGGGHLNDASGYTEFPLLLTVIERAGFVREYPIWNQVKERLSTRVLMPNYNEREIWWCSIGVNVGFEEDGKNNDFERPVLVLKKYNKDLFFGIPLTSKAKTNRFHFRLNNKSYAILSQGRTFSSMRFSRHRSVGKISETTYARVFDRYIKMLMGEVIIGSQLPESLHAPNGDLYGHYSKPHRKSQEKGGKK